MKRLFLFICKIIKAPAIFIKFIKTRENKEKILAKISIFNENWNKKKTSFEIILKPFKFILSVSFWLIKIILKLFKWLLSVVFWFIWDFSGLRYIWSKIKPPLPEKEKKQRRPATFLLWLIGLYIGLFGISVNLYENSVDRLENQENIIFSQIKTNAPWAIEKLKDIKDAKVPYKPEIFKPISVFVSLFKDQAYYSEIFLKKNIEDAKLFLTNVNLSSVNLANAELSSANFESSEFIGATLINADFQHSNLKKTHLTAAKCQNTNFLFADFENAILEGVNFKNANLCYANFKNVKNLKAKQLSEAFSLWGIKNLDSKLKKEVEKINPKIFKENYDVEFCNIHFTGLPWKNYLKQQKTNKAESLIKIDELY